MAEVSNFVTAICGVVAGCTNGENVIFEQRDIAVKSAIVTVVYAAATLE
ncbi:MAG: hypothetical protein ACYTXY_22240 [Nostoc sp.]